MVFSALIKLYVKLYICIMAFRNHKFSPVVSPPVEVFDKVLTSTMVDDVEIPVINSVSNRLLSDKLPALSEYGLSDLLQSGVPLTPVSSKVMNSYESEASSVVDDVINNAPAPPASSDSPSESD